MKAPTGDQFLPEISIEKLRELHKNEKNPKARDRLLAYMARKNGDTIDHIAKSLRRGTGTIHDWLAKANSSLDRLYDIKRQGPARRLTGEQLAELKEDLIAGPQANGFESSSWTGKMMARHVKNKYDISYVPRTMQELMLEMGLRPVRPKRPKAAPEEKRKALKKS